MTEALLSLIGGTVTGFVFKYISIQAQNRKEMFESVLRKIKAVDDSADKAKQRDDSESGKKVRRFIVISLMSGLILIPALLTVFGLPTIVEVDTPARSFFGLFEWGGRKEFYVINGYLITTEIKYCILGSIGYYMGNGSAKS